MMKTKLIKRLTLSTALLIQAGITTAQPRFLQEVRTLDVRSVFAGKQEARPAIITQTSDTAIPLVTNGDGLRTRITLLNLENTTASYQMVFVDGDGRSYAVPWAHMDPASTVRGTVPPNSVVELVTSGAGEITTGWSLAAATGARVVFSAHNEVLTADGLWNSATYYPGNATSKRHKIRFDNREGYNTTIVINNINTVETPVTIIIRNAEGTEIASVTDSVLAGANQYALRLPEEFPATEGILGTIEISIPTTNRSGISLLGFRLNTANGSFDLIDSFSTVAWSQ
jgi:hypothetical protein